MMRESVKNKYVLMSYILIFLIVFARELCLLAYELCVPSNARNAMCRCEWLGSHKDDFVGRRERHGFKNANDLRECNVETCIWMLWQLFLEQNKDAELIKHDQKVEGTRYDVALYIVTLRGFCPRRSSVFYSLLNDQYVTFKDIKLKKKIHMYGWIKSHSCVFIW